VEENAFNVKPYSMDLTGLNNCVPPHLREETLYHYRRMMTR
jgi:hypothetical protein